MSDLVFFNNAKAIASQAKLLGIEKVIVSSDGKIPPVKGIEFRSCAVLQKLNFEEARKFRQKGFLAAVDGASLSANRFAASTKGIDLLLQPLDAGKMFFDSGLAQLCARNNVSVAFLFSAFLNAKPFEQAQLFRNAAIVVKLLRRFKIKACVFSGAESEWEMRSPKDLKVFARLLGFTEKEAGKAVGENPDELFSEKTVKGFRVLK
ncbi:MAG: RNase P subunit p30 family protein [Candidatus Diapherotrites archaeon]